MLNRDILDSFRKKLQERNADSTYTNQDLYQSLMEQIGWIIKREIDAGKIYRSTSLFQSLPEPRQIVEVSKIPDCLGIKTNCKIYRTKTELPPIWEDSNGPIFKDIMSMDDSSEFLLTTPTVWFVKQQDPYQKFSKTKYCFYADGHLWLPKHNPHFLNITAYFKEDVRFYTETCTTCGDDKECIRFMDTKFFAPEWIVAEAMSKALQLLMPSKQMPEDNQIDKDSARKN